MNTSKIVLSIIFIVANYIQNEISVNTSEIGRNLFYKNTRSLHIAMNKLFTALKLNKGFKKTVRMKLLLTMHRNLISIIENNDKLDEIIKETDNVNIKGFMTNEKIDEIFQDNSVFPNNATIRDDISEEFTEYLKELLPKFKKNQKNTNNFKENLTNNHDNITEIDTEESIATNVTLNKKNLKKWVPTAEKPLSGRRLYKSKKTKVKHFSFMASVHVATEFVGAGAIIKKDFIITAASCLQKVNHNNINTRSAKSVVARIGSDYTTYGGDLVPISEFYVHPDFNSNNLQNNLAILKMDAMIHGNGEIKDSRERKIKIRRIIYDTTNITLPSNNILILGWGARNERDGPFEFLKLSYSFLDLYMFEECVEVYSSFFVTEKNFCTGFMSKGGGACAKDGGDPAVVDGELVGLVSFGPPLCGTPDAPTVVTRISHYVHWIQSIVKMSDPKPSKNHRGQKSSKVTLASYGNTKTQVQTLYNNPEEAFILREIINLSLTNKSMLEDVIDEGFNKENLNLMDLPSTKMNAAHYSLLNKNKTMVPDLFLPPLNHFTRYNPVTMNKYKATKTPADRFRPMSDSKENYKEFNNLFEKLYTAIISSLHTQPTESPARTVLNKHFTDFVINSKLIGRQGIVNIDAEDYVYNDDDDDDDYTSKDVSSNYEDYVKGLSIEMITERIYDKPNDYDGSNSKDTVETTGKQKVNTKKSKKLNRPYTVFDKPKQFVNKEHVFGYDSFKNRYRRVTEPENQNNYLYKHTQSEHELVNPKAMYDEFDNNKSSLDSFQSYPIEHTDDNEDIGNDSFQWHTKSIHYVEKKVSEKAKQTYPNRQSHNNKRIF